MMVQARWLPTLALMAAALMGTGAESKVARASLADLVREADYIVLARVEGLLSYEGLTVARATPKRVFKGPRQPRPFFFVAGQT